MLSGTLLTNEPMAKYNSWRVGGLAEKLYKPDTIQDIAEFMKTLPANEPITWLGLGSNVLVRDGGIDGSVVVTQKMLGEPNLVEDSIIRADAGLTCAKLARYSADQGFSGLEFLVGIPGTIGGALAMNAGAFGGETWNFVDRVEVIDRHGHRAHRSPTEYSIGYRSVQGPADEWFVAGYFKVSKASNDARNKIKDLLKKRSHSQPIGQLSCGSVFRNPPNDYAARLIEVCGLKGYCIGDAQVSEKHANFIINRGNACARDIESLILFVQKTVLEQQGISLQTEVRIIGRDEEMAL